MATRPHTVENSYQIFKSFPRAAAVSD